MSTQSGITPSDELKQAFKDLQASGHRALVLEIANETCVPAKIIEGSPSFSQDFDLVQKQLSNNEPRYIIYRVAQDGEEFVFISFVPDTAHVRSKMLYASSATNVHRQLGGSQQFGNAIFWSSLDEVSHSGWLAHKEHDNAQAPRTEEEQALQDVREKETIEMLGTAGRKSHYGTSSSSSSTPGSGALSLAVAPDVDSNLQQLVTSSRPTALGLGIDIGSETVIVTQSGAECPNSAQLHQIISDSEPQYTIYKTGQRVIFIYTCPTQSKVKHRMVYASSRSGVINKVKQFLAVDEVVEASDPGDVLERIQQTSPSISREKGNLAFSRPKRPGRK